MNVRKRYRRFVCVLLLFSVLLLALCGLTLLRNRIPDQIFVEKSGEIPDLFSGLPDGWIVREVKSNLSEGIDSACALSMEKIEATVSETDSETVASADNPDGTAALTDSAQISTDHYEISYSLFGKIPLKTVSAAVIERRKVYAGGTPVGIYLETAGVFVVDTGEITTKDGESCCPAKNIVQTGDYIQMVNGETVNTKEQLIACIQDCGGEALVMKVNRQGEQISLRVVPIKDADGEYRAGIWVRNDTQGIGTLTWVDEDGNFGALGHGISDVDTAELLSIQSGTLYSAEVISVQKGTKGSPGELSGIIHYSDGYRIGTIEENSANGIYGRITGFSLAVQDQALYETALKQEVEEGAATIRCTVDGTCREYEAEIREIRLNGDDVNKGMVIEVTDPELLKLTGGIVQGMSGSPIFQNGRIVGAVTHVFVNDPTRGYGIFIEDMI
ncbi:MAG: SpoIVB peptidase [Clostridiales bacterium]|nr:SpoIVB peptidase [Clostridiales bacterium]